LFSSDERNVKNDFSTEKHIFLFIPKNFIQKNYYIFLVVYTARFSTKSTFRILAVEAKWGRSWPRIRLNFAVHLLFAHARPKSTTSRIVKCGLIAFGLLVGDSSTLSVFARKKAAGPAGAC